MADPKPSLPLSDLDPSGATIWGGDPEAAGAALASRQMEPVIGPYLHDVATGEIARQGVIGQYQPADPSQSFAQSTADPNRLNTATDIALAFTGGGLGTKGIRPQRLRGPVPGTTETPPAAPMVKQTTAAPFPQYAEQYPPAGLYQPGIDKTSGRPFKEKVFTPEEAQFKKGRQAVMRQMEKGYEPYYPLAERSFVDPSHYPEVAYDTAQIRPAKQETIDKHLAYIGSNETRRRLRQGYKIGSQMPGAEHWYAMGQLERDFVSILGPEKGRAAFRDNFAAAMAATTRGQMPTPNMLMAHYLGYARQRGLPQPEGAYDLPHPIGGQYAMSNVEQYQKIFGAPGGPQPFGWANPKPADFTQSLLGYRDPFTWDVQMTRGATPPRTMPEGETYGLYEKVGRQEARRTPDWPSEFQGKAWAGFQRMLNPDYQGKPMIAHVNDAIERTHRLTGMSREEIVERGFVRGEIPLYGLAILGMMGLLGGEAQAAPANGQLLGDWER